MLQIVSLETISRTFQQNPIEKNFVKKVARSFYSNVGYIGE